MLVSHALAALLAVCLWEAARLVLRAAFPPEPAAPPPPDSLAVRARPAELAELAAERLTGLGHTPDAEWRPSPLPDGTTPGYVVFCYAAGNRAHQIEHLPPAVRAWLRGLTAEELALVRGFLPARLDGHIAGRRMCRGLPSVRPLRPPPLRTAGGAPHGTP